jgi:hypothetical protein
MDPQATLEEIRALVEEVRRTYDRRNANAVLSPDAWESLAIDFQEQFRSLDLWLSSGGFLPEGWRNGR